MTKRRRERPPPQPGYHPDNAAIPRETTGRSSLFGQKCTLVGYVFRPHPVNPPPWWVQTTVYFARAGLVICISEGQDEQQSMELGAVVPGRLIAEFAQRQIGGNITQEMFDELKPLFEEDMPGFHWLDQLPALS